MSFSYRSLKCKLVARTYLLFPILSSTVQWLYYVHFFTLDHRPQLWHLCDTIKKQFLKNTRLPTVREHILEWILPSYTCCHKGVDKHTNLSRNGRHQTEHSNIRVAQWIDGLAQWDFWLKCHRFNIHHVNDPTMCISARSSMTCYWNCNAENVRQYFYYLTLVMSRNSTPSMHSIDIYSAPGAPNRNVSSVRLFPPVIANCCSTAHAILTDGSNTDISSWAWRALISLIIHEMKHAELL